MPKRVLAFGEVASTVRNNLIADLLLLSKCHAPAQSLLGLGPRPRTFAPALCLLKPRRPQVQARKRGRVPYSHRLWSLAALHGVKGRQRYSGGGWAHRWRGLKKKSERGGETKKKIGESTITFLVFRTIPRGFLCVLTTPMRTQFSTLETKMRKKFWEEAPLRHC